MLTKPIMDGVDVPPGEKNDCGEIGDDAGELLVVGAAVDVVVSPVIGGGYGGRVEEDVMTGGTVRLITGRQYA